MAAEAGQLELNAFEPVIFDSLHQGCTQLCAGIRTLSEHCIRGIQVNKEHCRQLVERSASMATALCPQLGYAQACHLAQEAQQKQTSIRKLVLEKGLLSEAEVQKVLDPLPMTTGLER